MLARSFRIKALASDILELRGEQVQLNQVQEELAELIVAINHYRRNKEKSDAKAKLVSEMGDVLWMLHQLQNIIDDDELIEQYFNRSIKKVERLAQIWRMERSGFVLQKP